jgi:aspartyl-tRNA(Asn)/glutamyl-tRNA(Gln) amidotransferase subunit A
VGILTRDVRDCATILQAISGTDDLDQSTRSAPELSELQLTAEPKRPLRVGVMPFDRSACDEAVKKAFDESIRRLQSLGVTVTTPAISSFSKAPAAVWPIMLAEAHSTYKHWLRSRPHELTVAMRLRLILGALITASDYLLAQRWRKRLVEDFARAFAEVDLLVAPSASTLAPHIDDVAELVGAWTEWAPYNLTGLPTITVPNGRSDENLPTGLLFVARWFDEKQLLEGAWHYSSS